MLLCGLPFTATGCLEVTPVSTEQLWDHFYIYLLVNVAIVCAVVLPLAYVLIKRRRGDEEDDVVKTPPTEPGLKDPDEGVTCPHCGGRNKEGNVTCYRCGWRIKF